jgi:hypothetical protein
MRSVPYRWFVVGSLLTAVLTLQVLLLKSQAADPPEKKLGPEWKKVDEGLEKTIQVKVFRRANSDFNSYTVPLEHGRTITVTEKDNGRLCDLNVNHTVGKEVNRECGIRILHAKPGEPQSYDVNLRGTIYFDLNADGRLDRLYNRSNGKPEASYLLLDEDWLWVEDSKTPDESAWGEGRKVRYQLNDGKWTATPQK